MMPEDSMERDEAIDRFWDQVIQGRTDAAGDLNPADADVIRFLHAADDRPEPTPAFRRHLREDLMHAIPLANGPDARFQANGRVGQPGPGAPTAPIPSRSRWAPAHLVTAALLLLTIVGSFFAFGPGRFGQPEEERLALQAVASTPTAEATVEPAPLAEYRWHADGSPDLPLGTAGFPAVDPRGNVWYTDGDNHRFVIFAPDGTYLESWGTAGNGDGEFNFAPGGDGMGAVAFDEAGNIYVADTGNARIQTFDSDRNFLTAWRSFGEDARFQWPVALAVDGHGRVVVSDSRANTIQVFDREGLWLATWARVGSDPGQVLGPNQLAFDSQGNLWVAEHDGLRVQKFSPDGQSLLTVGSSGREAGEFLAPAGLAIDDQDRIFVSDRKLDRIQVFSADGTLLGTWGDSGSDPGQLNGAFGLALDGRGYLYVAEDIESRLQAFRLPPPLAPAGSPTP